MTFPAFLSDISIFKGHEPSSSSPRPREDIVGFPRRHNQLFLLLALVPVLVMGCTDDPSGPRELEPLVGVWQAVELVMTNQANPSQSVDLIEEGATFTLSILSDGRYSASLTIFGQGSTEMGTVGVSGSTVTITPTTPEGPPLVATWSFQGENLVLDGESEFDFNRDGIPEPSIAHIVLKPLGD